MKLGDLVRMESRWQFPKWFYGVVVEVDVHHYYVQWFDDGKKTMVGNGFRGIEVIDEKAIM